MRKHIAAYIPTQVLDVIICDWCRREFKEESMFNDIRPYEINEFTLKWRTGESYPEGGSGEETRVDLCFECRKKLKEKIENLGIRLETKDWDY